MTDESSTLQSSLSNSAQCSQFPFQASQLSDRVQVNMHASNEKI